MFKINNFHRHSTVNNNVELIYLKFQTSCRLILWYLGNLHMDMLTPESPPSLELVWGRATVHASDRLTLDRKGEDRRLFMTLLYVSCVADIGPVCRMDGLEGEAESYSCTDDYNCWWIRAIEGRCLMLIEFHLLSSVHSIAAIGIVTKSSLAWEGSFHLTAYLPPCREARAGTWKQEQKQRPWRNTAYWLSFHGLLSLHFYRTWDHQPREGTSQNFLGPFPSIIN